MRIVLNIFYPPLTLINRLQCCRKGAEEVLGSGTREGEKRRCKGEREGRGEARRAGKRREGERERERETEREREREGEKLTCSHRQNDTAVLYQWL
jgi:hypothetical protein